jgi:uncharacterized protein with HEPN domain
MKERDIQILEHVRDYCEEIAGTISRYGQDFDIFFADRDYYKSISMSLMQIGELSNKLSDEFKDSTRNRMPWSFIKGMRNMFAHEYHEMSHDVIWEAACKDAPELAKFCEEVLIREGICDTK